MPTIGDLRCRWSASPGAIGVKTGTVARNNLNAGVTFEPGCDRVGIAIGQEFENATAFQIADDRAIALSLAPGPVINADYTRGFRWLEFGGADHAQQRVAADRHGELAREPETGLAADGKAYRQLALAETHRTPRLRPDKIRQSLGEDPLRALHAATAKPSCLQPDFDNPSMPRQVGKPTRVVAV